MIIFHFTKQIFQFVAVTNMSYNITVKV